MEEHISTKFCWIHSSLAYSTTHLYSQSLPFRFVPFPWVLYVWVYLVSSTLDWVAVGSARSIKLDALEKFEIPVYIQN